MKINNHSNTIQFFTFTFGMETDIKKFTAAADFATL